jgi:hypothetical protein
VSQRAEANSIHCADPTSKHACQQLLKYRINNGNSSLVAAINIPGEVTIDVIVNYPIIINLATIPYTKSYKKRLVT